MEGWILYLTKVSFFLILFYLFFKVFLSRDTFFQFNRFILLGGVLFSGVLPLVEIEVEGNPTFVQGQFSQLESILRKVNTSGFVEVEEVAVGFDTGIHAEPGVGKQQATWWETMYDNCFRLLVFVYLSGCLFVLFHLLAGYFRMIRIIRKNRKVRYRNCTLVLCDWCVCPFCWGNYIVMSENDYENNSTEVLAHEMMHVSKRHTFDLLFMDLCLIFFWFNPAVWLLKKELQEIHEYEADNGVINQGIDATKYQLLLVKKAVGARLYSITNSFNHSKLKNRITMMLKEKSNCWARLKVLFFILPAALLMLAFARPVTSEPEIADVVAVKITQIPEKTEEMPLKENRKAVDTTYRMNAIPGVDAKNLFLVVADRKHVNPAKRLICIEDITMFLDTLDIEKRGKIVIYSNKETWQAVQNAIVSMKKVEYKDSIIVLPILMTISDGTAPDSVYVSNSSKESVAVKPENRFTLTSDKEYAHPLIRTVYIGDIKTFLDTLDFEKRGKILLFPEKKMEQTVRDAIANMKKPQNKERIVLQWIYKTKFPSGIDTAKE